MLCYFWNISHQSLTGRVSGRMSQWSLTGREEVDSRWMILVWPKHLLPSESEMQSWGVRREEFAFLSLAVSLCCQLLQRSVLIEVSSCIQIGERNHLAATTNWAQRASFHELPRCQVVSPSVLISRYMRCKLHDLFSFDSQSKWVQLHSNIALVGR